MSAYPSGFFRLIGYSGAAVLAYHCPACGVSYSGIPETGTIWCCGKTRAIEKAKSTLQLGAADRGAVDLNEPTRVGGVVIGTV